MGNYFKKEDLSLTFKFTYVSHCTTTESVKNKDYFKPAKGAICTALWRELEFIIVINVLCIE